MDTGIGSKLFGQKYGIKSPRQIRQWIHTCDEVGDEGLKRSRKNQNYSFEFKLHMVEAYLSNEVYLPTENLRRMFRSS